MTNALKFSKLHGFSLSEPEQFWAEAAQTIDWVDFPKTIFDPNLGVYGRWFPDGVVNTCYNAVDRHAKTAPERVAIIYDSPVSGSKRSITYREFLTEVEGLASVLLEFGVQKGDRVIIYMPMIPETVFAMMACARIGAIHSVVFGGFAARELATRIDDSRPKVILAGSCGIEPNRLVAYKPMIDEAIEIASHKPENVIVFQRKEHPASLVQGRDHDWASLVGKAKDSNKSVPCAEISATDPLYILYTSGTTGKPKGVVRDNGGHLVAMAWTMGAIYGIKPGDVFWSASDVGWVVGHSYIVYAPLIIGATTILYEGKPVGTPDAGAFWRVISEHGVKALFTAPTAFRAIRKEDPEGLELKKYDLTNFTALFLAGERADPDTVRWAEQMLGVPVIDHWWQTETGWAIAGNPFGMGQLPVKHGSPTVAMPGYDVRIVDEAGNPVPTGKMGSIVIKLPLPPSCLPTLWEAEQRFVESYLTTYPGYYSTSDAGYIDEDGYLFIMGRTDDIINVAGHRLSTGAMEEVLSGHSAVAECAVVGIKDALKGEQPCGFAVLKAGVSTPIAQIEKELVERVRQEIGPVAAFKIAIIVNKLPKTRSGKILRGTMKKIADGDAWTLPPTIDDPAVLDEIKLALQAKGLAK